MTDKARPAIRVAQSTDIPYLVVLRTVGPAGGWAAFSYNASELDNARGDAPLGDTLILPTFQWQVIPLKPKQFIYAKGGVANTLISISMSEMTDEDPTSVIG